LVVWNMNGKFFHILGISSSQLTNSLHHFFRGVGIPSCNMFTVFSMIKPQCVDVKPPFLMKLHFFHGSTVQPLVFMVFPTMSPAKPSCFTMVHR
jgi:hypothetical protein